MGVKHAGALKAGLLRAIVRRFGHLRASHPTWSGGERHEPGRRLARRDGDGMLIEERGGWVYGVTEEALHSSAQSRGCRR